MGFLFRDLQVSGQMPPLRVAPETARALPTLSIPGGNVAPACIFKAENRKKTKPCSQDTTPRRHPGHHSRTLLQGQPPHDTIPKQHPMTDPGHHLDAFQDPAGLPPDTNAGHHSGTQHQDTTPGHPPWMPPQDGSPGHFLRAPSGHIRGRTQATILGQR